MYIFAKGAVMLKMSKELLDEQISSELKIIGKLKTMQT